MSLDAIRQVGETEQMAAQLVRDAQTKAHALLIQAQRDGDGRCESAQKAAAQAAQEAAQKAHAHADDYVRKQNDLARIDCEILRTAALQRMDRAVSTVVEKVVKG